MYRFYTHTRILLGESASQIFKDLQILYGTDAPSRATVFRYAKEPENSSDVPSASGDSITNASSLVGRPVSVSTTENVQWIEELISENRRLSLRDIEELTGVNHELVRRILHDRLHRRFLCSTWVPHSLNDQQKLLRKNGAISIRNHLRDQEERDRLYAIQDETWVFFDPVLPKAANKAWVAHGETRPTVIRDSSMTKRKTLLSVIFTPNKKFHVQGTCSNETIDADYFINFLHTTGEKWRSLRSDPTRLNQLLIQFDNARPHASKKTKEFLTRRGIQTLWQPPYSPDLNLCDRWLFDRLKREIKKITFQNSDEVVTTCLKVLRS
ncbi:MAG: transposase, partial [Pseudomonadota bacterium]